MTTEAPPKKRTRKASSPAVNVEQVDSDGTEMSFRGDCYALLEAKEHEVMLAGPRDTGKTIVSCVKAHLICTCCPGAQGSIVRKTFNSMAGTVLQSFKRIIAGSGVEVFGGETPQRFIYPNGSQIWVGGMDNPQKVLSSERDFIYVNQAEELTLNDWEMCIGSCSGRGAVVAVPQIWGDCNPGGSQHWIRKRAAEGKLRLLQARHEDNPDLYDEAGNITPQGLVRIGVLDALSGVRYKRLRLGIWATAEGAVYDMFDGSAGGPHVMVRKPEEMKRWFMAIDMGFTNPFALLDIGEDEDGRWHCFREVYRPGMIPEACVAQVKEWWTGTAGRSYDVAAVDPAAAGLIASLKAAGVHAVGALGKAKSAQPGSGKDVEAAVNSRLIVDGIQLVQNMLAVKKDGRARYTVDPSCVNNINEFESYIWEPDRPKDTPKKENDHSLDALRYLAMLKSKPTGSFASGEAAGAKAHVIPTAGGGRVFIPRHFIPRR